MAGLAKIPGQHSSHVSGSQLPAPALLLLCSQRLLLVPWASAFPHLWASVRGGSATRNALPRVLLADRRAPLETLLRNLTHPGSLVWCPALQNMGLLSPKVVVSLCSLGAGWGHPKVLSGQPARGKPRPGCRRGNAVLGEDTKPGEARGMGRAGDSSVGFVCVWRPAFGSTWCCDSSGQHGQQCPGQARAPVSLSSRYRGDRAA